MTYAPGSSIVGYRPVAAGWRDALSARGATPDAGTILALYDAACRRLDLDPNLAVAQACHEATWFTSARWRQENNPAGLGITADNTPPNPFRTPDEGIQAHCEHLCCYVYAVATCPCDHGHLADRRHFFHDGLPRLADLERIPARGWANPGTGYVASIVAIANQVTGGSTPMSVPYDRTHISADLGPARDLASVKWFIVHDTEGRFDGDEQVLTSPAAPVESAHFLVGRQPGQCVLVVPLGTTAWTAGNDDVGEQAVQVELSRAPVETGYTDYQYDKLAELFRWCVAQGMVNVPPVYLGLHPKDSDGGPEPDDAGIIGHAGVPDGAGGWGGFAHHTDPGPDFDWPRFIAAIGNAPAPPPDGRRFAETGRTITGNIKGYWERFNDDDTSIQVFGFPVTDLVAEGGLPVQYFQRAILVDNGGRVEGRLLGAAAAKQAGYSGPGIP